MGYFANGTEGMIFEETWCSRCVHYDEEKGVDKPCPVFMAHFLYAYELCNEEEHPGKVILDMLITERVETSKTDGIGVPVNECQMFHEKART